MEDKCPCSRRLGPALAARRGSQLVGDLGAGIVPAGGGVGCGDLGHQNVGCQEVPGHLSGHVPKSQIT